MNYELRNIIWAEKILQDFSLQCILGGISYIATTLGILISLISKSGMMNDNTVMMM